MAGKPYSTTMQWLEQHPGLLNTRQLSELLGITEQCVYRLGRQGRLPIERLCLGKAVRYRADDVRQFLQGGGLDVI